MILQIRAYYILLLFLSPCLSQKVPPILGFCYYNVDNSSFTEDRYKTDFSIAQNLPGTSGWNAAELYTPLGPNNTISTAITAAVATNTKLLIAICAILPPEGNCSPGPEIGAINDAISQYGSNFTNLVVGIMMTDLAITASKQDPSTIAASISEVRTLLAQTPLNKVPIGTREYPEAWQFSSMDPIIDVCDFIFVRIYPMVINVTTNLPSGIAYAKKSLTNVQNYVGDKPVWVSTGWPNTGVGTNVQFALEPSNSDAKAYWDDFGCGTLFNSVNTFWGTVEPTGWGDDILGSDGTPVYNLTCPNALASSNGSSSSASASTTTSATSSPNQTTDLSNPGSVPDDRWKLGLEVGLGAGIPILMLSLLVLLLWKWHRRNRSNQLSKLGPESPTGNIRLSAMNSNRSVQYLDPNDDLQTPAPVLSQGFMRRVSMRDLDRFDIVSNDSRDNAGRLG